MKACLAKTRKRAVKTHRNWFAKYVGLSRNSGWKRKACLAKTRKRAIKAQKKVLKI